MDKHKFKKLLTKILFEYGFTHKNKAYYFISKELITVIAIQKSDYSDVYYINYSFLLKELHPELKFPKDYESDCFGRFILNCNGNNYFNINIGEFTAENFEIAVRNFMEKTICPVITKGLLEYFRLYPAAISTLTLKAKQYLNIEQ